MLANRQLARALSFVAVAVVVVATLAACPGGENPAGVPGDNDVALFAADTTLVFDNRVSVGSRFTVTVVARRDDDAAAVQGGALSSADESVLTVSDVALDARTGELSGNVQLVGPGETFLVLEGAGGEGGEIDRIALKAAHAKTVELLDRKLLGTDVDARLPLDFGAVDAVDVELAVAATDHCGQALLDLGATTLSAFDPPAAQDAQPQVSDYLIPVTTDLVGLWRVTGQLEGDAPLTPREVWLDLSAPGLAEPVRHTVTVVAAASVDEVDVALAAADGNQASLWGRAYADDLEVIGLDFEWSSTARVALSAAEGPVVTGTISYPAEGEPADERPAEVTAEVFGTEGDVDLFGSLVVETGRAAPAADDGPAPGPSCGEDDACDPYAAFLVTALLLRRLARRRERA